MPLEADVKQSIMTEYATNEGDTGSPEVQIAMLTQRIKDLTEHSRAQARPPQPPRSAAARRPAPPPARLPPRRSTSTATAALIERLGLRR